MNRTMFTSTFDPRSQSAIRLGTAPIRRPLVSLGSRRDDYLQELCKLAQQFDKSNSSDDKNLLMATVRDYDSHPIGQAAIMSEMLFQCRLSTSTWKYLSNLIPKRPVTTPTGMVPSSAPVATSYAPANMEPSQPGPAQSQGYQNVATPSAYHPPTLPSIPAPVASEQAQVSPLTQHMQPVQDMTQNPYSWNNAPGAPPPPPADVASVGCDTSKGEFPDGHGGCRTSVGSMPGIPGGLMDSGAAATGLTQLAPSAEGFTSFMGRRRVALRGVHSNGNLEWWSYQQAFLPPLYFSRPRVDYATLARPRKTTLGVGKTVPPGICCQATPDGGAICSTGQGFPPTCPNKPEPNVPGVAEYIQQGSFMVPKPPAAPVNGACGVPAAAAPAEKKPSEGGTSPLFGIAAIGALLYAATEIL